MLYKHFTEKLLGLQGLNITNIEENEKSIIIYAEMERKEHALYLLRYRNKYSA